MILPASAILQLAAHYTAFNYMLFSFAVYVYILTIKCCLCTPPTAPPYVKAATTPIGFLSDPWVSGLLLSEVVAALSVENRALIKQVMYYIYAPYVCTCTCAPLCVPLCAMLLCFLNVVLYYKIKYGVVNLRCKSHFGRFCDGYYVAA